MVPFGTVSWVFLPKKSKHTHIKPLSASNFKPLIFPHFILLYCHRCFQLTAVTRFTSGRGSKLQKEQQKRRDAARLRIQREKRAKEAAARDQARVEEQIKARKLEQRRKEEEVGSAPPIHCGYFCQLPFLELPRSSMKRSTLGLTKYRALLFVTDHRRDQRFFTGAWASCRVSYVHRVPVSAVFGVLGHRCQYTYTHTRRREVLENTLLSTAAVPTLL